MPGLLTSVGLLTSLRPADVTAPADVVGVVLAHGTTVATNAVLERAGGPVALVTTDGFADIIEIGRQDRPSLYDTTVDRPEPLVARAHRLEVIERLAADGSVVVPLDASSLARRGRPPGGVTGDRSDCSRGSVPAARRRQPRPRAHRGRIVAHRRTGRDLLTRGQPRIPGVRTHCHHGGQRLPATGVRAICVGVGRRRLGVVGDDLSRRPDRPGWCRRRAGPFVAVGPSRGVRAAAAVAAANDIAAAVTFDMGGTSTDVCLIIDGVPAPAAERSVDGLPVRMASLDVHTIGAGGGSVAHLDAGGALVVGPRSAGAVPGPASYGLGGTEPTVTDANVVLGRIPAHAPLPGLGVLDADAAAAALDHAGVDAAGVVAVVNAAMEQALRQVTVERGVDPAEVAMVAFGGAGGLHCCELADALGITTVLVPERAGVFSAVGVLTAPRQVDLVRSWPTPIDHTGLDAELDAPRPAGVIGGCRQC